MATSKYPASTSPEEETSSANDMTLDLIQQIALNKYGLKLVPKDSSCEKCPSLEKEKCDLQQFIGEISHCVKFLHDPRNAPNPDLMSSIDFQQKLKTHLQNIMFEVTHLKQFLNKPLNLADLIKSSTENPSTSANLTPIESQSAGVKTRKQKYSDCQQVEEKRSVPRVVFQRTLHFADLGLFKVNIHNMCHSEAKCKYFPNSVLSIVGRTKPEVVWDYISKMKAMKGEDVITFMLTPVNSQDAKVYTSVFTSLKDKERFGVLESPFKDVYLIPWGKGEAVPGYLLPFNGEGLQKDRADCLLAVVTRSLTGRESK